MSFSTSQLQAIRSVLTQEIRVLRKARIDARDVANTTRDAIDSGVFDHNQSGKAVVVQTMYNLRNDVRVIREKVIRLSALQRQVKIEIRDSLHHDRESVEQVMSVVAEVSSVPILGAFTEPSLVANVVALSELQNAA